jgi:hypothetical protein
MPSSNAADGPPSLCFLVQRELHNGAVSPATVWPPAAALGGEGGAELPRKVMAPLHLQQAAPPLTFISRCGRPERGLPWRGVGGHEGLEPGARRPRKRRDPGPPLPP